MKFYAIYKNNEFIGFPFNSYDAAYMMLMSIKDLLSIKYKVQLIDDELHNINLNDVYLIRVI